MSIFKKIRIPLFILYFIMIIFPFVIISCGGSEPVEGEEEYDEEGDDNSTSENVVESLNYQIQTKDDEIAMLEEDLKVKKEEYENLLTKLSEVESEFKKCLESSANTTPQQSSMPMVHSRKGLYYRIQLGAIYTMNSGINYTSYEHIIGDNIIQEGGYDKVRIGFYKTYNEAKTVEFILRKSGINNTWVVPMLDGMRISVRQAQQIEFQNINSQYNLNPPQQNMNNNQGQYNLNPPQNNQF